MRSAEIRRRSTLLLLLLLLLRSLLLLRILSCGVDGENDHRVSLPILRRGIRTLLRFLLRVLRRLFGAGTSASRRFASGGCLLVIADDDRVGRRFDLRQRRGLCLRRRGARKRRKGGAATKQRRGVTAGAASSGGQIRSGGGSRRRGGGGGSVFQNPRLNVIAGFRLFSLQLLRARFCRVFVF